MVPVISPVVVLIDRPGGQVGRGIRQRVGVEIGGARVEVDDGALGMALVGHVLVERRLAVDVGDRPAERVGRVDRGPVADGDADRRTGWAAAVKAIVPLISPVEVLIVRPGGRLVAPYMRVSPSGSVAPPTG